MKAMTMLAMALFLAITAIAQDEQWSGEFLSGNVVNAICFSGPDNGYAVGGYLEADGQSHGIILRTSDGGKSWDKLGTNFYLHSLCFMNETRGYAIGEYILRTTNAGDDWQIVSRLDREYLQDMMHFPVDLQGYFIGEEDRVLKNPEDHGPYGIEEQRGKNFPRIYPNPAASNLVVEISGDVSGMVISLLTIKGQVLSSQSVTSPATVIDLSSIPSGAYLIRVSGAGKDLYRKFLKQ